MLTGMHNKILAVFSSRSPAVVFLFNVVILLVLGWVDFITGDYSLIVFYLIPVSLAAWFIGKYFGMLFCLLSIVVRVVADESSTPANFSHSMMHYWNELIEFLFLLVVCILCSALKKNLESDKNQGS